MINNAINNIIKIIKRNKLFRISTTVVIVLILSWGVSSVADDNIKSATNNFSAMGLVSDISDDSLEIKEARGSDKSGKTTYDLNIDNLEKIQTNKNEPINFTDIKEGDRIIVQGLTNGSTFFIKRIITFTSTAKPVATTTATTTESDVVSTSTATTTEDVVVKTNEIPASTSTTPVDENVVPVSTSTSVDENISTSTPGIIDTVIDSVKEAIENIVDTITGNTSTTTPETITPTTETVQENQAQDIPLQQLIENTETVSTDTVE